MTGAVKENIDTMNLSLVIPARKWENDASDYSFTTFQNLALAPDYKNNPNEKDDLKPIANTAYFDCEIGFQQDFQERNRILIEYDGDRNLFADYMSKTHSEKLQSVLKDDRYKEENLTLQDFSLDTFMRKNSQTKAKMVDIIFDNFENEIKAIGIDKSKVSVTRSGRERGKRKDFLINLAKNHRDELYSIGFSDKDIKQTFEEGRTPNGFNVHHKLNRFHTSAMKINYNAPENLILISCSELNDYHAKVHEYIDSQTGVLEANPSKKDTINLVWLPGNVYDPNKKMSRQEIIEQSKEEMSKVFEIKTPADEKEFAKITKSLSTAKKSKGMAVNAMVMQLKKYQSY